MTRLPPPAPGIVQAVAALPPAKTAITRTPGRLPEDVEAALVAMRKDGTMYDFGDRELARVVDGQVRPVGQDMLALELGRIVEFWVMRAKGPKPADVPLEVLRGILTRGDERGLAKLVGVVTAPTLRADASVLDVPGYDAGSGIYYHARGPVPRVPERPSGEDALAALAKLWHHFRLFPFEGPVDRGVILAALMTAVLRGGMPKAPAFGFSAHDIAAGKTLLAECVSALASGVKPDVTPPKNAEELRKQLYSALLVGRPAFVLDNLKIVLGGAALATLLTASTYTDRTLGVSEQQSLPNRMTLLVTGNNLRVEDEISRRVRLCHLDAKKKTAHTARFPFDPLEKVLDERLDLVVAVLTIVRAWVTAGKPIADTTTASGSYAEWDALVRYPLLWVASLAGGDVAVGDPNDSIKGMAAEAPENDTLDRLLAAVLEIKGEEPWSVGDLVAEVTVYDKSDEGARLALREVLVDISNVRGEIDKRRIGTMLYESVGRRRDTGRIVKAGHDRRNVALWRVAVEEDGEG